MNNPMDEQQTRCFLKPHVRQTGPCGVVFASGKGVRAWAGIMGFSLREAMCALLSLNIWPERFCRNYGVFSAEAMIQLLRSRILLVGCGGLGGHVAALAARLGVGAVRLCDPDVFEESNLNRQYFCTEKTLGQSKAWVTGQGILDIASYMDVDARAVLACPGNFSELLGEVQVVVDCLDAIPIKKLLEEAALAAHVSFVHGSVLREEGFAFLNASGQGGLARLYPSNFEKTDLADRREAVSAIAPAGVACLMSSLLVHALIGEKGATPARTAQTGLPLYHLDFSVPEMERFSL